MLRILSARSKQVISNNATLSISQDIEANVSGTQLEESQAHNVASSTCKPEGRWLHALQLSLTQSSY